MDIRIYYEARIKEYPHTTENRSTDVKLLYVPNDFDNFGIYVKDDDFIRVQCVLNISNFNEEGL